MIDERLAPLLAERGGGSKPPPPLVPLAELLDRSEFFIRRFVVLDEAQATAVALWVTHTWVIEAAHATPYLFVTSAEAECGKTRLLEVTHELVRAPLLTMNISDAALFRAIHTRQPTLFFDEVDSVFSQKARERGTKDELRALLNAGYRRGQVVLRMGGGNRTTLEGFNVFGAKALAGLGSLPHTLASRCLRIELKRRRADEPVEDFYPLDVAEEAGELRSGLEVWAASALDTLAAARPAPTAGLRDRTNEVWRPLLAIAELAGPMWAARARRAATTLASGSSDDEASLGVLLLADAREVFDERDAERLTTADLLAGLCEREESPWAEWWLGQDDTPKRSAPRRLAQLLHPFGVRSKAVWTHDGTKRGYKREDFRDAWERFLGPRVAVQEVQGVQGPAPHGQTNLAHLAHLADGREPMAEQGGVTSGQQQLGIDQEEVDRLAALSREAQREYAAGRHTFANDEA
jgi:Protein of unknown function (DUF3631)